MTLIAILSIAGLVALGAIWISITERDPGLAIGATLFTAIIGFFAYGVAWLIIAANPNASELDESVPLVALASDSSTQGSFFLGSGVIDGEQTFAYLADRGGYYVRESALASRSRVYVDGEPRLEIHKRCNVNRWLTPWDACMGSRSEHHFYVPEGSIHEGFEVTP